MFRKLTLTALLATGTLGAAATASANAPAAFDRRDHDRGRFRVLVRERGCWEERGTFRDRDDAERAAHRLERRGCDVRVERERGW